MRRCLIDLQRREQINRGAAIVYKLDQFKFNLQLGRAEVKSGNCRLNKVKILQRGTYYELSGCVVEENCLRGGKVCSGK